VRRLRSAPRSARLACSAGFTYLGALFLIALMGLALTVVSEMWHTVSRREKEAELLFVGAEFRRAFAQYQASGPGYPRRLEDLLKDPRFPEVRRHLRKIYRDPITGRAEWGLLKAPGDTIAGVYSLSEDEPLKKTGFGIADQAFEGKTRYSHWVFSAQAGQGTPGAAPSAPAAPLPAGNTGSQQGAAPPVITK
jgi:type II secretory pathway pseudopilin PulG